MHLSVFLAFPPSGARAEFSFHHTVMSLFDFYFLVGSCFTVLFMPVDPEVIPVCGERGLQVRGSSGSCGILRIIQKASKEPC